MTQYFLGLDIGGTKSHALVADEAGRALGFAAGPGGNPSSAGYAGLSLTATDVAERCLAAAGLAAGDVAGAGFGIAGYDWPSQTAATLDAVSGLGLSVTPALVNDTLIGLYAGAVDGWGVALVAGTGCNCRGLDRSGREGRVLGLGQDVGEAGGGSDVVQRALQGIAYEWTRRGPATELTRAFTALTGATSTADLLEGYMTRRYRIGAEAAPIVFRIAAGGDAVATGIMKWTGQQLGDMAVGVIRQLDFEPLEFDVVLVGSIYNGSPILLDELRKTIRATAARARLRRLTAPPVVGGVLLGMAGADIEVNGVRARLANSATEMAGQPKVAEAVGA